MLSLSLIIPHGKAAIRAFQVIIMTSDLHESCNYQVVSMDYVVTVTLTGNEKFCIQVSQTKTQNLVLVAFNRRFLGQNGDQLFDPTTVI